LRTVPAMTTRIPAISPRRRNELSWTLLEWLGSVTPSA
jgi:hypothetical protein